MKRVVISGNENHKRCLSVNNNQISLYRVNTKQKQNKNIYSCPVHANEFSILKSIFRGSEARIVLSLAESSVCKTKQTSKE